MAAARRPAYGGNFVTGDARMTEPDNAPQSSGNSGLGTAGWIAVVVLVGLLVAAIAYAVHTWNELAGVSMPVTGWLFMILGAVFTFALGGGLMALLFYSSRKGKDF
jgi:hypothetical protein